MNQAANDNATRWTAVVRYRCEGATYTEVTHRFEEMAELDALVEQGPHWDTIISIVVRQTRPSERATLTVEEAARM